MAFGNSITEGKTAFGAIANTYPVQLARMLTSRYTAQPISVVNRGFAGEGTAQGAARLRQDLNTYNPDVLLLEEGVNDLSGGQTAAISPMIEALRDMIRTARARGVHVFLGTLLPVRANSTKTAAHLVILEANDRIRQLAFSENVRLVDLYAGFGGNPDPYIDVDGLHPTEAGYGRMAELFFDAIRAELEVAQGPASLQLVRNQPPPYSPTWRRGSTISRSNNSGCFA
jgi:lysophospholipase L1-like esterase